MELWVQFKKRYNRHIMAVTALFCLVVFVIVAGMTLKSTWELQQILQDSVKWQLTSISHSAQRIINTEEFLSFDSLVAREKNSAAYEKTLGELRALAKDTGAQYIYALRMLKDGTVIFVFDTDHEVDTYLRKYDISPVHIAAFRGEESAGILNVVDEYGSYNTGAIPIWDGDTVVGIIGADIADVHILAANRSSLVNAIVMCALLIAAMALLLVLLYRLIKQVRQMQTKLEKDALFDAVTGLPNRKHLIEHLDDITHSSPNTPYALFFIDLDNFKSVNDTAGHDVGDELLKHIADFLSNSTAGALSFRPEAGQLNIAARIGGDEFVQIVQNVATVEQAGAIASNLLEGFAAQASLDRFIQRYGLGLSIGVALYPEHSGNYHVLIKCADIAMYHAKNGGKNSYRIYDEDMQPKNVK